MYPDTSNQQIVRYVSSQLAEGSGWMKFLGLLSIIGGASQVLSLVGILWGWLPIWMGILLFQAAGAAETARLSGDHYALAEALKNVRTYFVINGVLTLLGMVLSFTMVCLLIILPMLGFIPFLFDPSNFNNY